MQSDPTSALVLWDFLRLLRQQKWNYKLKGRPCLMGPLRLFLSLLEKHIQGRAPLTHESSNSSRRPAAQSCVKC